MSEIMLGHEFSMLEAAKAVGVSRDTIKRRLRTNAFPHAHKDSSGAWLIPLADLVAAGLPPIHAGVVPGSPGATAQEAAIAALEARIGELTVDRDRAYRLLEMALQRLPSGLPAPDAPREAGPVGGQPAPPPTVPQGRLARWWHRK